MGASVLVRSPTADKLQRIFPGHYVVSRRPGKSAYTVCELMRDGVVVMWATGWGKAAAMRQLMMKVRDFKYRMDRNL